MKRSGLGKVVFALYRHPKEDMQNKAYLKQLIEKWHTVAKSPLSASTLSSLPALPAPLLILCVLQFHVDMAATLTWTLSMSNPLEC